MKAEKINVEAKIAAPIETVWRAWIKPDDIKAVERGVGRLAHDKRGRGPARRRHVLVPHGSQGRQYGLRFCRHLYAG